MHIYLDTSQLSQISNRTRISSDIDEFFKQWNEKNYVLCLSLQHLREIAQLEDKQSREKRLGILRYFRYLRFTPYGWPSIIKNEAIVQMLNHFLKKDDAKGLFKENIWKRTDFIYLLNYVQDNLGLLLKSRKIYEVACEIEEIFKPARKLFSDYSKRRIKSLNATRPDNLKAARKITDQLQSTYKNDVVSNIFIEKIFQAVQETGSLSNALINLLELEKVSDIEKRYLSDASSLAVFNKLAYEAIPHLAKITGVLENEILDYIANINPSSCPGFSLRTALLRALHSSDKIFRASDWMDADYIVYAPYVDIFYADKRTCDFLRKETRNQPFRIEQSLVTNIRRIVPLNKLLKDISL